jgi:hypothetical protein
VAGLPYSQRPQRNPLTERARDIVHERVNQNSYCHKIVLAFLVTILFGTHPPLRLCSIFVFNVNVF